MRYKTTQFLSPGTWLILSIPPALNFSTILSNSSLFAGLLAKPYVSIIRSSALSLAFVI